MLTYPLPEMCQGADEDLVIRIGNIMFPPDAFHRRDGENGVRVWVDAPLPNPFAREQSLAMFRAVLGVLRAWRAVAGGLLVEEPVRLAPGPIRDEAGNQWVEVLGAQGYAIVGDEVERLADNAFRAIKGSENLRRALVLNGRPGRTGADYYMIHEYALMEFSKGGNLKPVEQALGVTVEDQKRLRSSACNLPPLQGGRHAFEEYEAEWNLDQQRDFTADLLQRWIYLGA